MAYRGCCPAAFPAWLLGLAICSSGVGSQREGDPVEHEPPVLKPVRWQRLDECYQNVFIDSSGRAWFFCTTPNHVDRPKWAYLVCPELPDKTIQMPGQNVPIGFDSRNRFWDIGKLRLCCTDVQQDTFFERRLGGPGKNRSGPPLFTGVDSLPFAQFMFEHSSGRLYFFDSEGVHVLDGATWSYHKFSPPLQFGNRACLCRNPFFPAAGIIEGSRGEVYVWSSMCDPAGGLRVHDGAAWKSYTGKDHPALAAMDDVFPQADGTLRVQILPGYEVPVTLPDRMPQAPTVLKQHDPLRDARNCAVPSPPPVGPHDPGRLHRRGAGRLRHFLGQGRSGAGVLFRGGRGNGGALWPAGRLRPAVSRGRAHAEVRVPAARPWFSSYGPLRQPAATLGAAERRRPALPQPLRRRRLDAFCRSDRVVARPLPGSRAHQALRAILDDGPARGSH